MIAIALSSSCTSRVMLITVGVDTKRFGVGFAHWVSTMLHFKLAAVGFRVPPTLDPNPRD